MDDIINLVAAYLPSVLALITNIVCVVKSMQTFKISKMDLSGIASKMENFSDIQPLKDALKASIEENSELKKALSSLAETVSMLKKQTVKLQTQIEEQAEKIVNQIEV